MNILRNNAFVKSNFLEVPPRLGRVKHLSKVSFWLALLILGAFLQDVVHGYPDIMTKISLVLVITGITGLLYAKIRRLNDFDYAAQWLLLSAVPLIGGLWLLAIFIIRGTEGDNQFGPTPPSASLLDYLQLLMTPVICFIMYSFGFNN